MADLSFISLRLVLDALVACLAPDGDLVPMVKPQFEVGRERVGAGGVVRDPALRADAVLDVAGTRPSLGLGVAGVVTSPLPGPSGNVEFFLWLRRGPAAMDATRSARSSKRASSTRTVADRGRSTGRRDRRDGEERDARSAAGHAHRPQGQHRNTPARSPRI